MSLETIKETLENQGFKCKWNENTAGPRTLYIGSEPDLVYKGEDVYFVQKQKDWKVKSLDTEEQVIEEIKRMKYTVVWGSSDDLIEVEGEVQEEYNVWHNNDFESDVLKFSDGTILSIKYVGTWRIDVLTAGPKLKEVIPLEEIEELAPEEIIPEYFNDYTDLAIFDEGIKYVTLETEENEDE